MPCTCPAATEPSSCHAWYPPPAPGADSSACRTPARNARAVTFAATCCVPPPDRWYYGWIPVVAGLAGGAIAGGLVSGIVQLLEWDQHG